MNRQSDEHAPALTSDTAREAPVERTATTDSLQSRNPATKPSQNSDEANASESPNINGPETLHDEEHHAPASKFERERQPYHRSSFPQDYTRRRLPRDTSRGWHSDKHASRTDLPGNVEGGSSPTVSRSREHDQELFAEDRTIFTEPTSIGRISRRTSGHDHLNSDHYFGERRQSSRDDDHGQYQHGRRHHQRRHSTRDYEEDESWDDSVDSQSYYSDEDYISYIHEDSMYDKLVPSSNPDDNNAPLVERCDLSLVEDDAIKHQSAEEIRRAWLQQHSILGNGIETELAVINAAEGFTVEAGKCAVTLYCQKDDPDEPSETAVKHRRLYWL